MRKRRWGALLTVAMIGSVTLTGAAVAADDAELLAQARQLFKPLPQIAVSPENPVTPAKVRLGRMLFFDPRFSSDGSVSCVRCHLPALYGTDGLPKSIGVGGRMEPRHAPTVLNSALQVAAHWRGDRASVEDQAMRSFGQPDQASAIAKIKTIQSYRLLFEQAFPGEKDPVTSENWGKAIGAFERTLQTPAPFDAFLNGDTGALSREAKAGLQEFAGAGCAVCHNGVGVGGGMFQRFGMIEDYWKATGSKEIDKGRFDVTKREADLYVFKVPSLRNVAMTPPYFHDGSVASLPETVQIMGRVQLNKALSDEQVARILAFLQSLTGSLPPDFASAPVLPPAAFK